MTEEECKGCSDLVYARGKPSWCWHKMKDISKVVKCDRPGKVQLTGNPITCRIDKLAAKLRI